MARKDLSQLIRAYVFFGINDSSGKFGLRVSLYAVILPLFIVNLVIYVVYKWDDLEKRVDGFKGLVTYISSLVYLLAALFSWDKVMLVLRTIEEGFYEFPFPASQRRKDLMWRVQNKIVQMNTIWYYILPLLPATAALTPIVVFFLRLNRYGIQSVTNEMLYLPIPFYFPRNYDTLPFYFISYAMQTFIWFQVVSSAYLVAIAPFISMKLLEGDLKLLRLSLEEMDEITSIGTDEACFQHRRDYSKDIQNITAKRFLEYFVKHHIAIYRKVNQVTKGMQFVMIFIKCGISVAICTGIYSLVKGREVMVKFQQVSYSFMVVYFLYCYDSNGEDVSTEDENVRQALYRSPWIDKPSWFKKSLQIIMTRTNKTIEINTFGLFAMNLKSFVLTMRAAYSFYNLMNNVKI